jgi:hypothetical protein
LPVATTAFFFFIHVQCVHSALSKDAPFEMSGLFNTDKNNSPFFITSLNRKFQKSFLYAVPVKLLSAFGQLLI